MCVGSTPKAPSPPPRAPEAPKLPEPSTASQVAADKRRRAAAGGQGSTSTILTSPRGVQTSGATATKTLLGL